MCQDCYSPGSYADDDLGYDDQDDDWGDDGYEPWPGDRDDLDDDDGDDRYDEFKDGVAMGYLNPDGSQREPDPPRRIRPVGLPPVATTAVPADAPHPPAETPSRYRSRAIR